MDEKDGVKFEVFGFGVDIPPPDKDSVEAAKIKELVDKSIAAPIMPIEEVQKHFSFLNCWEKWDECYPGWREFEED